jgi:hypothetical protein
MLGRKINDNYYCKFMIKLNFVVVVVAAVVVSGIQIDSHKELGPGKL